MKRALGLLIALTAAGCSAGGSTGGTVLPPSAAPAATAVQLHAQAVGAAPTQSNGSPLPWVQVTSPAPPIGPNDSGETVTLAGPVPVYNIGSAYTVAFTFTANTNGIPVAVQVGTVSSYVDLDISGGTLVHNLYVNGKSSIPCMIDSYNFNEGAIPSQPIDTNGTTFVDYFACAGNPFP